jgi:acyl-CoA thioester hydrolase
MDTSRTDARPFVVDIPLTVKTYDVDFSGVVSHLTFIRWLEDLRLQMLAENSPLQRQVDAGGVPVVARTAVHYRHPLAIGEALRGRMWVQAAGRSRWILGAEFCARGRIVAVAYQTGCFLDLETRRPIAIRPELRARVVPAYAVHDRQTRYRPRAAGTVLRGRPGWREALRAGVRTGPPDV